MFSNILRAVATSGDQDELLNGIDILRDSLYNKDSDIKMRLQKMRADFGSVMEQELENAPDKAKTLDAIRLSVKQMRVLNMRVGFQYDQILVQKVAGWVKDQVGEDVVVDLQIDQSLIGGATISFAGVYRDYSVRQKLDKVWKH